MRFSTSPSARVPRAPRSLLGFACVASLSFASLAGCSGAPPALEPGSDSVSLTAGGVASAAGGAGCGTEPAPVMNVDACTNAHLGAVGVEALDDQTYAIHVPLKDVVLESSPTGSSLLGCNLSVPVREILAAERERAGLAFGGGVEIVLASTSERADIEGTPNVVRSNFTLAVADTEWTGRAALDGPALTPAASPNPGKWTEPNGGRFYDRGGLAQSRSGSVGNGTMQHDVDASRVAPPVPDPGYVVSHFDYTMTGTRAASVTVEEVVVIVAVVE